MTVFDPDKIQSQEQVSQVTARLVDEAIPLPLDDFIRDLANNSKRRLSLREFAGRELTFARTAVRRSFFGACLMVGARRFSEATTDQLSALAVLLRGVAPKLEKAISLIGRMGENQNEHQDLDFRPFGDLQDSILRVQMAIRKVEPLSRQLSVNRSQNAGNVWRISFVGGLFQPWRELTGGSPQPNGPFVEFVESAWRSLSSEQPDVPFERAIKTAKKAWQDSGP